MFILAVKLAQQQEFSVFRYAQENLTVPKGEGMDPITFKTFAYLRPHDEPVEVSLENYQDCTQSSLRAPWVIIKMTPVGCKISIPFSYLLNIWGPLCKYIVGKSPCPEEFTV